MIALMGSFKLVLFMMRLTIVGFGNQAKSWALNLKDSGFPVRVALRPGSPSLEAVKALNLSWVQTDSVDFYSDKAYALLTPDSTHAEFLSEHVEKFQSKTYIVYAHGHSLLEHSLDQRYPQLEHILFAPKSIGSELRNQFLLKGKLGAVYSLEKVKGNTKVLHAWLLSLSQGMGINMGPYSTTFRHETEADLFSEQGLLCSLIPYTAGQMFEELIKTGIEPELAYFECWHELKLIINAMVDKGPEGFFELISPNALIGSEKGFQKLFTDSFRKSLRELLVDIQSGKFNQELSSTDVPETRTLIRKRWQHSPLQETFKKINQELK